MTEKYLDKDLYEKAKRKVDREHKKPSAYKNMALVKEYKRLGGKFRGTKDKKGGTINWRKEDWRNLTGVALGKMTVNEAPKCGNKYKGQTAPSICRPRKEAVKYSKAQLRKALNIKKKGETINWKKL